MCYYIFLFAEDTQNIRSALDNIIYAFVRFSSSNYANVGNLIYCETFKKLKFTSTQIASLDCQTTEKKNDNFQTVRHSLKYDSKNRFVSSLYYYYYYHQILYRHHFAIANYCKPHLMFISFFFFFISDICAKSKKKSH